MTEQIKQIGIRIKELREISNLDTLSLAKEFNIDEDVYKAYEQGTRDISMSFLQRVAERFNVDITELLTGTSPHLKKYTLTRKDKAISVERYKRYKYQSLAHNFTHKKADPFIVTIEPNDNDIYLNTHTGQEFNYVIEGTLKLVIDNTELILNEGDSIYFDSTAMHGMKAMNNETVKFLAIIF